MAGARMGTRGGRRGGGPAGGIARQGQLYWGDKGTSRGKVAGIGWALKSGSFRRCVARVEPHLGAGAKGYCAKRFHAALGVWPGSRANGGKGWGGRGRR